MDSTSIAVISSEGRKPNDDYCSIEARKKERPKKLGTRLRSY